LRNCQFEIGRRAKQESQRNVLTKVCTRVALHAMLGKETRQAFCDRRSRLVQIIPHHLASVICARETQPGVVSTRVEGRHDAKHLLARFQNNFAFLLLSARRRTSHVQRQDNCSEGSCP